MAARVREARTTAEGDEAVVGLSGGLDTEEPEDNGAAGSDSAGDGDETEERDEPAGQVTLSDGRVFRLHTTNALHDLRLGKLMNRLGMGAAALGQETYSLVLAVAATATIDGAAFEVPKTEGAWNFLLRNIPTPDAILLRGAYAEMNLPEQLKSGTFLRRDRERD